MAAIWDDDHEDPGFQPYDGEDERDPETYPGPDHEYHEPPPPPPEVIDFAQLVFDVSHDERKTLKEIKTPHEFADHLRMLVNTAAAALYAGDAHNGFGACFRIAATAMIWQDRIDATQKFVAAIDVPPKCATCGKFARMPCDLAECGHDAAIPF